MKEEIFPQNTFFKRCRVVENISKYRYFLFKKKYLYRDINFA